MKIISWNVNGIRSAASKGLITQLAKWDADIVCFQETKATEHQVAEVLLGSGYNVIAHSADKKGYSGTALISKSKPISTRIGVGHIEHDGEGRFIVAEFSEYYVCTAYVPNSKSDLSRIPNRQDWDVTIADILEYYDNKKPVIYCGDLNVAHKAIDLANSKSNYNRTPGHTQIEIDGMDYLLNKGFVDSWRIDHPAEVKYSWWSMRSGARSRNIGWRLDYHVISKRLVPRIKATDILNEEFGSDHCPVVLEIS
ncbi:MAG: Exodeoxyribonuclease [Owenweeksia sp. TMED14]|nr:MAG: Exodeoxyribonuclease [Owenweeksia sp. TMED14]